MLLLHTLKKQTACKQPSVACLVSAPEAPRVSVIIDKQAVASISRLGCELPPQDCVHRGVADLQHYVSLYSFIQKSQGFTIVSTFPDFAAIVKCKSHSRNLMRCVCCSNSHSASLDGFWIRVISSFAAISQADDSDEHGCRQM